MKTIFILLLVLASSTLSFAKIDGAACSRSLYPTSPDDQAFVAKFFDIVELHKSSDPLLEGKGPSVNEYSLDKMKFAFMVNDRADKVDLVFFNWTLPTFSGLEIEPTTSQLYGSSVYILKDVDKKSIASQGDNNDQLTNFSYMHGARYIETQLKIGSPNTEVPEEFLNWKPHPGYMDRSHPLRQTLDTQVLVLLSPTKELFLLQAGATDETRPFFEQMFSDGGGYHNMIMGMMVHEMFHVKEGEDQVNGLASPRDIAEDRQALEKQLQDDQYLKSLFITYAKIVFSIGDSLKNAASAEELEKLSDLKAIISEIKVEYPNAWSFIWNYEFTEGFAEYVSAYSMVKAGITSFSQQIDLQKADTNNFAYRTGAIGGLYLAYRLKQMPFENNEDHVNSLWEIILDKVDVQKDTLDIQSIMTKYDQYPMDAKSEIGSVIDYLVSTIMDN
ncbi:MAG: hypothetical protein AABZ31_09130 [Bdellovibrionota bacterium]